MKIQLVFFAFSLLFMSCSTGKMIVNVPANETVEIDYPEYPMYKATLKNRSFKGLDVAVLDKESGEQKRGFGLGIKGKVDVMVEEGSKLVFKNDGATPIKIKVGIQEENPNVLDIDEREYVSFTLENTTAKSIPLIIPTVMNPNLSPFSKSGVNLKIGQKILFKAKGKKYVLLIVDKAIKDGDVVNVAKRLKERKKELKLK